MKKRWILRQFVFQRNIIFFPLKDRKKTYCETRVYLKIPKNKKIVMATKLLFSIAYKEIGTSQILLQDLRQKEKIGL